MSILDIQVRRLNEDQEMPLRALTTDAKAIVIVNVASQ